MNELKKSKLESLRAKLVKPSLDANKTIAIKGGTMLQGIHWPQGVQIGG